MIPSRHKISVVLTVAYGRFLHLYAFYISQVFQMSLYFLYDSKYA